MIKSLGHLAALTSREESHEMIPRRFLFPGGDVRESPVAAQDANRALGVEGRRPNFRHQLQRKFFLL